MFHDKFACLPKSKQLIIATAAHIDRQLARGARRALSSKPDAGRCCCRSTGQTDEQADGRTPDRYVNPAPHRLLRIYSVNSRPSMKQLSSIERMTRYSTYTVSCCE